MREIIGKLITPQEGEVSPLFLQLVVVKSARLSTPATLKLLSSCVQP